MYGHSARRSLLTVLKEAPEMKVMQAPNSRGKMGAPTDHLMRQLTDRILMELWMRGFAVSARRLVDKSPTGERVDRAAHDEWRKSKIKPPKGQTDVEGSKAPA